MDTDVPQSAPQPAPQITISAPAKDTDTTASTTQPSALPALDASAGLDTASAQQVWLVLAATIVTACIQALRKSGALTSLPKHWIPVLSTALSVLGGVSASLASGAPLENGLANGILIGLSATGFYEVSQTRKKGQRGTPAAS